MNLTDPVSKVPLIGPSYARRLEKLGILSVQDLLYHLPSRYDDFSHVSPIANVKEGETVTVQGKILDIKNIFTKRGFVLQRASVADNSGMIEVLWFNQRFLTSAIHKGDLVSLSGIIKNHHLEAPDYEVLKGLSFGKGESLIQTIHTGRLVPVYPETSGISSKWLRSRINFVLQNVSVTEFLPETDLMNEREAIVQVHFPDSLEKAAAARERLAFDELLVSQLEAMERKRELQKKTVGNKFEIARIRGDLKTFVDKLPFTLTKAQETAIDEIYKDLSRDTPMNRLLQGDVGSGKTVVAALAMLAAHLNGFQSTLMAPTEILANQHHQTLTILLKPLGIGVGIATGSTKDYSDYSVIVGTHALLSDKLNFKKLGLVVIDEQHRFGVEQRAKLTAKGINPHILTMTATPRFEPA